MGRAAAEISFGCPGTFVAHVIEDVLAHDRVIGQPAHSIHQQVFHLTAVVEEQQEQLCQAAHALADRLIQHRLQEGRVLGREVLAEGTLQEVGTHGGDTQSGLVRDPPDFGLDRWFGPNHHRQGLPFDGVLFCSSTWCV